LALGLPWIFADGGLDVTDVRLLGKLFLAQERTPAGEMRPAVHLGHHHGMDGVLLALTGVALSRQIPRIRSVPVRDALSLYLAVLLVYGTMRAAEDAWNEQVVKRGGTAFKLPIVVAQGHPAGSRTWGAIIATAAIIHRLWVPRSQAGRVVYGLCPRPALSASQGRAAG
jgi:hypothetical protein